MRPAWTWECQGEITQKLAAMYAEDMDIDPEPRQEAEPISADTTIQPEN